MKQFFVPCEDPCHVYRSLFLSIIEVHSTSIDLGLTRKVYEERRDASWLDLVPGEERVDRECGRVWLIGSDEKSSTSYCQNWCHRVRSR